MHVLVNLIFRINIVLRIFVVVLLKVAWLEVLVLYLRHAAFIPLYPALLQGSSGTCTHPGYFAVAPFPIALGSLPLRER
jgi:hypothetical protein